jgi:uncharacterized membrane protein
MRLLVHHKCLVMKSAVGVFDSHDKALEAVQVLKDAGYPVKQLSIIGKADIEEVVDKELHVQSKNPLNLTGIGIGTTLGAALGVLTGAGVFLIPGLGFLYGAGALVGAIAGFDFGLIGGGVASVLATVGIEDEATKGYQKHLSEGKYLVVAQGNEAEVKNAMNVIQQHGRHSHTAIH